MKYKGQFVKVRNLEKYQHYSNRCPPWIKLHRKALDDYDFTSLPDETRWHAMAITLLATECDNRIPADPEWIGRRIHAMRPVDLKSLIAMQFLVPLADCKQSARPETEERRDRGETETEERGAREETDHPARKSTRSSPESPAGAMPLPAELDDPKFATAWAKWLEYRSRVRRKAVSQVAAERQLIKLARVGVDAACEAIAVSIENDWQGLFPEKIQRSGNGASSITPASSESNRAKLAAIGKRVKVGEGRNEHDRA